MAVLWRDILLAGCCRYAWLLLKPEERARKRRRSFALSDSGLAATGNAVVAFVFRLSTHPLSQHTLYLLLSRGTVLPMCTVGRYQLIAQLVDPLHSILR